MGITGLLTSARYVSRVSSAWRFSVLIRDMKLDRLLNTYNKLRTANTTCMSLDDSRVIKCYEWSMVIDDNLKGDNESNLHRVVEVSGEAVLD